MSDCHGSPHRTAMPSEEKARCNKAFCRYFYCAWLEKEHMERFLLPSLESVMDSKIKDSEGRIRKGKNENRINAQRADRNGQPSKNAVQ